ncbi:MAG TPA: glycosyltransferase family 1 protein [Acidimicrobiales bacterium]
MTGLRVNVPGDLFSGYTMSGRGRMWHEVLTRLADLCQVRPVDDGPLARLKRRRQGPPDAWLFDGHLGPLAVPEPQVIQLHEAPWTEADTMLTLGQRFIEMVVEPSRRSARAAAAIVCPSESAKRQIVEDCDVAPEVVFVAHHGVDHRVFHPGIGGGSDVVRRHGGQDDRPYVLTVASVHPRKNLQALRTAVTQLASEGFPHQLVVVGGPAHGRPDWEALAAAAFADLEGAPGRLIAIPAGISDGELAALMGGASAFCLPSLSEGFGLPAAEAMACGAPTVLANRGALPEVGAGAAVMVEPNPSDIADGLRSLLIDPVAARVLGDAGAVRAQAFSWDRCAAQWLDAITAGVARDARAMN